jgi:hypothetical protein
VRLLLFFGGGVLVRFSLLFGETFPLSLNKAATRDFSSFSKQSSDKFSRQSPKTKESQQQKNSTKICNKKSQQKRLNRKKSLTVTPPTKGILFPTKTEKKQKKKTLP